MERFWNKVQKTETCWLWEGAKQSGGYGRFIYEGFVDGAHRVAYRLLKGPIPKGLHVCHSCDTPSCVNPDHLWVGIAKQNQSDCIAKGRKAKQNSKLTIDQVREIRDKYIPRKYHLDKLASEYGVDRAQIHRIVTHQRWKDIV